MLAGVCAVCFSWLLTTLISCDVGLSFLSLRCLSCLVFVHQGHGQTQRSEQTQDARRLHHQNKIRRMSRHETFFTEKKVGAPAFRQPRNLGVLFGWSRGQGGHISQKYGHIVTRHSASPKRRFLRPPPSAARTRCRRGDKWRGYDNRNLATSPEGMADGGLSHI